MIRLTLILAAAYLALVGAGLMFVPLKFGVGAVPSDASPQLVALLRLLGGPFLGIAALNWLSRGEEPGRLQAVLAANFIGFGAVAANDIWGVATGEAREIAKAFLIVHLAFAIVFFVALRKSAALRAGGN